MSLTLVLAISCQIPKIVIYPGLTWNRFDTQTLEKAKVRCGELYKQSPCVKVFYKKAERTHSVVCGKGN